MENEKKILIFDKDEDFGFMIKMLLRYHGVESNLLKDFQELKEKSLHLKQGIVVVNLDESSKDVIRLLSDLSENIDSNSRLILLRNSGDEDALLKELKCVQLFRPVEAQTVLDCINDHYDESGGES